MDGGESSRLKQYLAVAADLITTVTFAIPLVVVVVLIVIRAAASDAIPNPVFVAAVVGAAGIVLASLLQFARVAVANHARGYKWVGATYSFEFDRDDPRRQTNRMHIEIEAVRTGVKVFENKYQWTGAGREPAPVVHSANHTLLGNPQPEGTWHTYYVYLGGELRRRQRATLDITQHFEDLQARLVPMHAKTVFERMTYLEVRTIFPVNEAPRQVELLTLKGTEPTSRLKKRDTRDVNPQTGEAKWTIKKPRFRYRYTMKWSAADGPRYLRPHAQVEENA